MCQLYAKGFEKARLIDKDTVSYYQTTESAVFEKIDAERATSEVALVNMENGEVVYGEAAFTTILSHENKWLKAFFQNTLVSWVIRRLYRFISFNRHVITGPKIIEGSRDCAPEINGFYRWFYIVAVALTTGLILNNFTIQLFQELGWVHDGWREYAICFGQIIWQGGLIAHMSRQKRLDYLGNMSTVSLIGGLLLVPTLIWNHWVDLSAYFLILNFMIVVGIMLYLHFRRTSKLNLPVMVTLSWMLYRMIWLIVILSTIFIK